MSTSPPSSYATARSGATIHNKTDALIVDAKQCGSPKGLRTHFQEYEKLAKTEHTQKITKLAIGCAALSSLSALPSAIVSIAKNCPQSQIPESRAMCGTNVASIAGALLGVTGIILTAHSLYLGKANLRFFILSKDQELGLRFRPVFLNEEDQLRADNLMTRYSQLPSIDRERVQKALFSSYLRNKRPVRATPPEGLPALEL